MLTNPDPPQPSTAALVKKLRSFIPDASFASDALDELASALTADRAALREALTDAVVRWEALSKVPISGQSVTLIACANEMREILAHEQEKFALSASPSTDAPAAERTCGLAARWDRTADGCFDCRDKATTPQARARLEAEGNIYRKCAAELRENMPPEPPTATDAFPGKLECLIAVLLADADLSYDETRHRRWLQTAQTMLA